MPDILAEDYSGCFPFSLAVLGTIAFLGLISIYLSYRPHWSGPAIAWPVFIIGFLATATLIIGLAQVPDQDKTSLGPGPWLIYTSPILTGLASIITYSIRKTGESLK